MASLRFNRHRFGALLARRWPWLLAGGLIVGAIVVVFAFVWFESDDVPPLRFGPVDDHGASFSAALHQTVDVPMRAGHRVEVLDNGEVFDALVADIATAERSIHVIEYIWAAGTASDRLVEAIASRAKRGVECRIVVDGFGSADFQQQVGFVLEDAGCEVLVFRGDPELSRNHRKIVVIDGRVAITGGFGVRDEWLGGGQSEHEWRDTAVRFMGPAVGDAQQAFAENWLESGGEVLPQHAFPELPAAGSVRAGFVTSSGAPVLTRAERLMQLMIHAAQSRVWIANAYFVPSDAILQLLEQKGEAGVDVRVLTAGRRSDSKTSWGAQRMEYGDLLEHQVRIWEYEPTMMHSKTMVIDDELSMIGTINLDPLSLGELEENALVIEDRGINEQLAAAFEADLALSSERSD